MKNQHQLLYKVMRHFVGMQRIDVFDLLFKIEILLSYTSKPLAKSSLKHIIEVNTDLLRNTNPFLITVLPNGNFCECVGVNDWLYIYKEQKKGIYKWKIFDTYYFKIKHPFSEIKKLTKKNLLEGFQDTSEEVDILDFLKKNRGAKKEKFIQNLLLLDIYNTNY